MHNFVKDLVLRTQYKDIYIATNCSVMTGKNGNYLAGKLKDKSGEIDFRMWAIGDDDFVPQSGTAVEIEFICTEYKGLLQATVSDIVPVSKDEIEDILDDLMEDSVDPSGLIACINETVEKMDDEDYKKIVTEILGSEETYKKFISIPAAIRHHHAYPHGLLIHTVSVLKVCKQIAEVYPSINRDLLFAGAILHDIGKIKEYEVSELGLLSGFSEFGELEGHLYIGARQVAEACRKLGISEAKQLQLEHLILSHHGKREYGAVAEPKTPEAVILHHADNVDATVMGILEQR